MHQSKPQPKSTQSSNPEPALGIPNFKALDPVSPSSYKALHLAKNNKAKTPASCRNSQQTSNSTSAFDTPKKQRTVQDIDVPIKEDYLSFVFRKKLEKERSERPDQAQTPDSMSSGLRTPVKNKKVLKTQRSDPVSIKGLKTPKEVHVDNVVGKESIQTLIKASKVKKRSKSVTSLKKLLEKAKQGILEEDSQLTDRTQDDKSNKNFVEKYISKTKGKEQKTPKHREGGFTLFTSDHYNLSRSQIEDHTNDSVTPRSSIDVSGSLSKKNRKDGHTENLYQFKVNRPNYTESIWASPKRTQQVEFGEKTVEFILKNGFDKSKEEQNNSALKIVSVTECDPVEEPVSEAAEEVIPEHEEVQKNIDAGEENHEEEEEKEEQEEVERHEEKEEEFSFKKEEEGDNNEEIVRTFEREIVVAREVETEEKIVASVPRHIIEDNTLEHEPSQEELQEQKEQAPQEEVHEIIPSSSQEKEVDVKETAEEVAEIPQEPTEPEQIAVQEFEEPVVEVQVEPKTPKCDELQKELEEIKEEEEEEELPNDVVSMFQSKMAKIDTWKRLGNQENPIGLLKEVIQNLEEYEKAASSGEVGEKMNIVPHKIHAYNMLASELYETGEYEKALESLRKVAEVDKCNIQALNKAFQIHTKLGNPDKAKNILKSMKRLMQSPMVLQYNQQFLLDNVSLPSLTGSQGASSQGDMLQSRLSFFNYGS